MLAYVQPLLIQSHAISYFKLFWRDDPAVPGCSKRERPIYIAINTCKDYLELHARAQAQKKDPASRIT